jgi:hypothetical protein
VLIKSWKLEAIFGISHMSMRMTYCAGAIQYTGVLMVQYMSTCNLFDKVYSMFDRSVERHVRSVLVNQGQYCLLQVFDVADRHSILLLVGFVWDYTHAR